MEIRKPVNRSDLINETERLAIDALVKLRNDAPEKAEDHARDFWRANTEIIQLLQSGVYSNTELVQSIHNGNIVCHPLDMDKINGSSIDVSLGRHFFTTDRTGIQNYYTPFDAESVARYFGEKSREAIPYGEYAEKVGRVPNENIPLEHEVIPLKSGERILAHTHEFIGIRGGSGTTAMQSRSTWGRNGISVCLDAGWGDPGYVNRWTMEIYNWNNETVLLPVGERIAQIVFMHTGKVDGDYGDDGKYQSATEVRDIVREWSPANMIPRAFKDERKKLVPIYDLETGEAITYESGDDIRLALGLRQ